MLIGNLGQKPEVKYLQSGQAVCNMSLATNEKWKDKDGKPQERVEWHRVIVYGKMGEACGKYLDKGRAVFVEGRIATRNWDDKQTGDKRYITEIIATSVQFLGGGKGGERRGDDAPPRDDDNGGGREWGPPADDTDIPF